MLTRLRDPQPGGGRGWRRLSVVLAVLLGHALLLGTLFGARSEASPQGGASGVDRAALPPPVRARLLVPLAEAGPQGAGMPEDRAPRVPAPAPQRAVPRSPVQVLAPAAAAAAADPPVSAGPLPPPVLAAAGAGEEAEPQAPVSEPPVLLASASSAGAAPPVPGRAEGAAVDAGGSPGKAGEAGAPAGTAPEPIGPVPVYPTRLPPPFTLDYELSRGPLSGSGTLVWQPGPPYALRLEGRVPILGTVITQTSQGGRGAQGLEPLRFTDRRIRRGEQAANFQRERGLVSFSGPATTYPLLPGAQDRLSWMVQIAGIAEAAPARLASGPVSMFVVGARGDADVWNFRLAGRETLTVGGQPVPTVQLLRELRRPHDTRVEVWLAPDAHHLPVRARMIDERGEAFELMLRTLPAHLRQ